MNLYKFQNSLPVRLLKRVTAYRNLLARQRGTKSLKLTKNSVSWKLQRLPGDKIGLHQQKRFADNHVVMTIPASENQRVSLSI